MHIMGQLGRGPNMRLGAMRLLCVLAACHLAGALRVAPPVTTRRALLSQLAAATSLASTPAFAQQAAPEAVVRPPCGKQGRWLASAAQPAGRGCQTTGNRAARGMVWR